MRLAFIGGRDIHKLGGIEAYTYNLCTELVKMGHEPIVFCESDRDDEEIVNGFKVYHQKSLDSIFKTKPYLGLRAVNRLLKDYPDIKFYHFNHGGPALLGGQWARFHNITTLIQQHGIEWRRTKWTKFQRFLMKCLEAYAVKFCGKYSTSVSLEQVERTEHVYHKHCWYIPTAVNLPSVIKDESVLNRFEINREGYYLYLGRLVQDKNPDYLIKAYLSSGVSDRKLVIAGSNDQNPDYVAFLKGLANNSPNVIFTGAVYGDDKETLLKHCAAFCIPSTIEGLAITLLEAMSYARICIASDIPANKEGLGENAIWVKPEDVDTLKDAIVRVNSDYESIKLSGRQNYERIKKSFTWARIASMYMDMVNEIMSKNK